MWPAAVLGSPNRRGRASAVISRQPVSNNEESKPECAAISSGGCLSSQVSPNSYSAGWALEGYAKATLHCVYRSDFIRSYSLCKRSIQQPEAR